MKLQSALTFKSAGQRLELKYNDVVMKSVYTLAVLIQLFSNVGKAELELQYNVGVETSTMYQDKQQTTNYHEHEHYPNCNDHQGKAHQEQL